MTLRALRTAPLLLLLLASCGKDGGTPSFIRIGTPTAKNADGTRIEPSAITDFWVFANDEAIGVWQSDRRIPVLAEGITNIKLVAGVRKNGITIDRIQYPFYATWSQDVDLNLGQETSVEPVFTFYNEPVWTDGFESTGFDYDFSLSDTTFYRFDADLDPDEVLVGDWSAGIILDADHDNFLATTVEAPSFPNGTSPTFLEIDYRSDTRFLVGVRYSLGGQTTTLPYLFVNATGPVGGELPWRHVYIDLGSAWVTGSINRQFYIQAQLENGATSGRITLDNLNVYH